MPLISGTIPSLVNGVSQQPASLRMPTQGELQENAFSHISRGLEKRPCTEHVAEIAGVESTDSNDVFIHTIRRSEDEAYALVVKGGVTTTDSNIKVKLFDLTGFATGTAGTEVFIHPTVQSGEVTANGTLDADVNEYLANFVALTNPFKPSKLSATTIADFTFLLNKSQKIKKVTTTTHDTRNYEALIHFRIGDYDSTYNVVVTEYDVNSDGEIDKDSAALTTITSTYATPDNEVVSRTVANVTNSNNNQDAVVIANIAKTLTSGGITHLTQGTCTEASYVNGVVNTGTFSGTKIATAEYNAATSGASPWTVTYATGESVIHIENNRKPFVVEITDGKGDTYVRALNGSDEVANFALLPATKIDLGFVAKVSGATKSGQDDYYVKWNGTVWKETNKPKYPSTLAKSTRKSIDATTMPMQLFKEFDASGDIYFVLKPVTWDSRKAGDDTTNPFPSFVNYDETSAPNGLYTINDIYFHRNRLGFISDENVILSEAASYFNFFANTVLSVLDTATIDVAVSNNQVAILNSAIPFQENLLLFSDLQQFKLTSDEFLTPTTVMIDVASGFETSSYAKPVPAGKTIFFPFQRGSYSGIREYMIDQNTRTNDANEVTTHIPEYIEGTVQKLAVSSNEETLFVLSNTDRKTLFIYKYYYADQEKLQSSWSKWVFDADIIDMQFIGSIGFFLFRRGSKIYLEKINLSVDAATTIMDDKIGVRLDRRVKLEWSGSGAVPALSDYYSDNDHDSVGDSVTTNGAVPQRGNKLSIQGLANPPRIGQTFKMSSHDVLATYTVLSVGLITGGAGDIEITPSIGATKTENEAGPVEDGVSLVFAEREPVYVSETGEVIKEAEVATKLQYGTQYSQTTGNSTPVIFAGIPYEFKYRFSEQFVKNEDQSVNSGRLQIRNFEIAYDRTGYFNVEVSPKPFDNRLRLIQNRYFTGLRIGSAFLGQKKLDTGVFRVPVYVNSRDVKITVNSDSWYPVALQSADWEAYQVLRNRRI